MTGFDLDAYMDAADARFAAQLERLLVTPKGNPTHKGRRVLPARIEDEQRDGFPNWQLRHQSALLAGRPVARLADLDPDDDDGIDRCVVCEQPAELAGVYGDVYCRAHVPRKTCRWPECGGELLPTNERRLCKRHRGFTDEQVERAQMGVSDLGKQGW
jgi:hypothetical protein